MLQYLFNGLCTGLTLALLASGFALIYHATRVFHIAHAAVFTVSGYVAYWILSLRAPPTMAAMVAVMAASCVGLVFEWLVYRPLAARQASPLVVLVASFGGYIATVHIIALMAGNEARALTSSLTPSVEVAGMVVTKVQVAQLIVGLLGLGAYYAYLRFTEAGRWTRAMASNPLLLLALGVNEPHLRSSVFLLGSVLAAIAGLLTALDVGIHPQMGFNSGLLAALAVILAGPNQFLAASWFAVAVGVAQNLVLVAVPSTWKDAMVAVGLLAALLYRRRALLASFPRREGVR